MSTIKITGWVVVAASTTIQKFFVGGNSVSEKSSINIERVWVEHQKIDSLSLPKGCLGRNHEFQSASWSLKEIGFHKDEGLGKQLINLWEQLNLCDSVDSINLVEKRRCGASCKMLTPNEYGTNSCRGNDCLYFQLIQAAKTAIINSSKN